mgnify:CR=1 FL=1
MDVSHEDGEIETEERELIYNVFEFSDTCAKDIMIPRVKGDVHGFFTHLQKQIRRLFVFIGVVSITDKRRKLETAVS